MKTIQELLRVTSLKKWTKILGVLVMLMTGVNFTQAVYAEPAMGSMTKQNMRCTPQTCTSYRANYERAIANGIITRPYLVEDDAEALAMAYRAISQGDKTEATRRLAQALVIVSENKGFTEALALERRLDAESLERNKQTLRQFLPLFDRIFPMNGNPYQ